MWCVHWLLALLLLGWSKKRYGARSTDFGATTQAKRKKTVAMIVGQSWAGPRKRTAKDRKEDNAPSTREDSLCPGHVRSPCVLGSTYDGLARRGDPIVISLLYPVFVPPSGGFLE